MVDVEIQDNKSQRTSDNGKVTRANLVVNTTTIVTLLGVLWNVYDAKDSVVKEGREARTAMAEESRKADKELATQMATADQRLTQELTRVATKMENVTENLSSMRSDVIANASQLRNILDRLSRLEAKVEILEKGENK